MIAEFHFLRPWWLLGLAAAFALPVLLARHTDLRARWGGMIAPALLEHLIVPSSGARRLRPVHLAAALIGLGALAVAGPTWERERSPLLEDTAPLVIAIDLSETMDATDVSPSRLERAKLKVQDLLELRKGARTAVFAYAGSAHMVLPLTEDAALVKTYVAALATRLMPVRGKDTAVALLAADASLARAPSPGTILFLTDGVEPAGADAIAGYGGRNDLVLLAIGTAEGGAAPRADGGPTEATGDNSAARLDIGALEALGRRSRLQVATATADDADVRWVVRHVQAAFAEKQSEEQTHWRDMGWWLTIPIAMLGAFWFRRGGSVQWAGLLVVILIGGFPAPARAAEPWLADMWATPDQQGRRAFERGDFVTAAKLFRDAQWRASALYRAGRFEDAAREFARAGTADGYYNQGNALMHLGRPGEAVQAYERSLRLRPRSPVATANLAVAQRLAAELKEDEDQEDPQEPNQNPDQVQFDDKGEKGKAGMVNAAAQTAEMWMRNIQVTPADLLARRFAIEAGGGGP